MASQHSFRIEAKTFIISLEGGGAALVKIIERVKLYNHSVFMSKEGARWLAKCVEDNITREADKSFICTYREKDQGFVIRRLSNDYGLFVEVMVCGNGGVRDQIVIPEGFWQGGWQGFGAELRYVVDSIPIPKLPGSVMANQDKKPKKKGGGKSQVPTINGGHSRSWRSTLFPHVDF